VVQHEVDHLDGILYPMRLRSLLDLGYEDTLFPNGVGLPPD
jgi:peptide deformylase